MKIALFFFAMMFVSGATYADGTQKEKPQNEVNFDMVSDTVAQTFDKANAILSGDIEITMTEKEKNKDDYTINAMGLRVPTKTAIKTGSALHDDEPL